MPQDRDAKAGIELSGLRLARPVVLIGLMGAGKTSVGARLAQMLGVDFADSDEEIVNAAGMSIADIFERFGEPHFRSGERRVIARLLDGAPRVIATGGGAFMDAETRALIAERATSVWLSAGLELLVQRTAGRTHRPILNRGRPRDILSALIAERYPVYRQADIEVQSRAGQTHRAMALRIIDALLADGRALRREEG